MLEVKRHTDLSDIPAASWQDFADPDHPFTQYGFLRALEESGAVGGTAEQHSGWQPFHLSLQDEKATLLGALPGYLKYHSYGEYVFDHAWADAYERAGGRYYPKLQVCAPFTPAPGPRLLSNSKKQIENQQILLSGLQSYVEKFNLSSAHLTFVTEQEYTIAPEDIWLKRQGLQYHWQNRNYSSFDDFLENLTSRKRKAIRKERKALDLGNLKIQTLRGPDIQPRHWDQFYQFYLNTIDRKWGHAYLPRLFFERLHHHMADQLLLICVVDTIGEIVAAALNVIGTQTLYGRYWGCKEEYKFLHFETCYYQSQEFAIHEKLATVQAGAQGEHKVQRGYLAVPTYSLHHIANPEFRHAVDRFLQQERPAITQTIAEINAQGPYRQQEVAVS